MGFFTSWPTPEVSLPMAAMRRESSSSDSISSTDSRSCSVTSAPRPCACVVVVNKIHRSLNASSGFGADLFLHQRARLRIESLAQRPAQHRGAVEDLARMQAQNVVSLDLQKTPRRLRNQHRAPVPGEQQNAVLQIAQNLVEIVLQRGEYLFHIAHALPDLLDLGRNPCRHVLFRLRTSHSPACVAWSVSSSRAAC